jgi:DtxR family Mn-dependent transcriptional regulator
MELSESLEDYLITIYDLSAEGADVHSRRVAQRVGVSTASVTHAFRALRERGLIEYERYQAVRLTEAGVEAARRVVSRKRTLIRFFNETLGLEPEEAEQNAHRMEHVITENAVDRLEELVERMDADRHTDGSR